MTFGLRIAAQIFQRFVNHIMLEGVDFLFVNIDDIVITRKVIEIHKQQLI